MKLGAPKRGQRAAAAAGADNDDDRRPGDSYDGDRRSERRVGKKEKKTKAKYVDLLHLQANGGGCNQSCHLLQLSLTVID